MLGKFGLFIGLEEEGYVFSYFLKRFFFQVEVFRCFVLVLFERLARSFYGGIRQFVKFLR